MNRVPFLLLALVMQSVGCEASKKWQQFNCSEKQFSFFPTHAEGQDIAFFKPVFVI